VLSSSLLGITLDRFDDFWTGSFLGPTALGYYSRAYDMATYPQRILATPLTNVFFPTYAAVQDDKEILSKAFFRSSSFLVRVGFLFSVVLMATAPELTLILFGEKWLPIVPLFRLMLVYIFLDPLYINLSYLMIGVGKPSLLARVRLIQMIIFVVTVILFAYAWGARGVAMAANIMMLVGTTVLLILSRRLVNYSLIRLFKWPTIAAVLSGSAGLGLMMIKPESNLWVNLILISLAITICYGLILYLAERDIIHEYGSQFLKPLLNRLRVRE
ncbi:MAG: oligosaccharide flippase family protein, partial [Anaerolineales bacterium]|nr:oligosaccharide flippase family protein [Anaerolineales bacterium]